MAHRQLHRTFNQAVRRASPLVVVAACLMVVGGNVSAIAEQGLKIRLLSAEEETWDQRVKKIEADILTPPDEVKQPTSPAPSVLKKAMPGYLSEAKPESSTSDESGQLSLLDQEILPYQESSLGNSLDPSFGPYNEQQRFQHRLLGIRGYLQSGQEIPLDEDAPLSMLDGPSSPQEKGTSNSRPAPKLVWRFSPFKRIRLFGSRFLGPSHSREAFAKLFPWNRTPGRNQGVGEPLINDSWRWAPFGVGWFMGFMDGSTLVTDWTGANTGYFGGYHANWDFDHYWGFEFRYGVASLPQWDNMLLYDSDTHGLPSSQFKKRHAMLKYGDFSFLYYPWGDAKWRPYARAGLGWGYVKFTDLNYKQWSNATMTMPIGLGLKYRYSRRLVFRMEMVDNFLFGERGINPQHNFSLTAGVEVRFGGAHKAYWPYNPGRHYW